MTNKIAQSKSPRGQRNVSHSGMMGDGTQEQSLGERGNPAARIKKREVKAAFGKRNTTKPPA